MIIINLSNDTFECFEFFLFKILPELCLLSTVQNKFCSFEVIFVTFFSHVLSANEYDGQDCDIFAVLNAKLKIKRFIEKNLMLVSGWLMTSVWALFEFCLNQRRPLLISSCDMIYGMVVFRVTRTTCIIIRFAQENSICPSVFFLYNLLDIKPLLTNVTRRNFDFFSIHNSARFFQPMCSDWL